MPRIIEIFLGLLPIGLLFAALPAIAQNDAAPPSSDQASENSTVVYDRDFIESFPNAVSVLDIIDRIPGGRQILGPERRFDRQTRRGFSNSDDRILINGKRISGKENDSRSALRRITVDQVARIELIRGSSPDIKTSSQKAIINIVLLEGAATASGSWNARARSNSLENLHFGGFLSYGGAAGNLEYFLSAEADPRHRRQHQVETIFDPADVLETRQIEAVRRKLTQYTISGNFGYTLPSGTVLRLNGQVQIEDPTDTQRGTTFAPDGMGGFDPLSRNLRLENDDKFSWEIGGDTEIAVGDVTSLKLLWLRGQKDRQFLQTEDFDFTGDPPENDVVSFLDDQSIETIGRASVTHPLFGGDVEVGSEVSFNRLESAFSQQERIDGVLQVIDVETGDTTVKEARDESFIIYTRPLSPKSSLEAAVFVEVSRLTQRDESGRLARNFSYLRPSLDYRYNLTARDQFQASIRRKVGQLNFEDFASKATQDDEISQGNRNINPETSWEIELSVEHRLENDAGSFKVRGFYERFDNKLQQIEVSPGVSGIGNVGRAHMLGVELTSSLRFGFIGLPDLLLEAGGLLRDTSVRDAFLGIKRDFDQRERTRINVNLRHDLTNLGLSYGIDYERQGRESYRDFDEITIFSHPKHDINVFLEGGLFKGLILRLEGHNLANRNFGRNRFVFGDGVATGILTQRELRRRPGGRSLVVILSGTF